jgi:hypothetical protein
MDEQEEGEKDSNQDPAFVKSLLALHDKFVAVVNQQFEKNSLFHKARAVLSVLVGLGLGWGGGLRAPLLLFLLTHPPTTRHATHDHRR